MKQYYRIAGLVVEMDTFGKTLAQAQPYAISDASQADVCIEQRWQALKAKRPDLSEDSCEYVTTGAGFYKQLINFDGMMIHASAVVMDGRAYLFTAPCGTGKSTHTSLWLRAFGERAFILNDDKPAVRLEDGAFYAYGTPWSGKTDRNVNCRVPLGGICILSRGERNVIERVGGRAAIVGIFSQTLHPKSEAYMDRVLKLLERLLERVPIWQMQCNMDVEAALVSHEAMSQAATEA